MNAGHSDATARDHSSPSYADAWLWVVVDELGRLAERHVLSSLDALAPLEPILSLLPQQPDWQQPIGRLGPMENIPDWTWRARWIAVAEIDAFGTKGTFASQQETVAGQRLLHISMYPRLSIDAIGWLDLLPDCVIGRDAKHQIIYRNRAAQAHHCPELLEQLNQDLPSARLGGVAEDQVTLCDQGQVRYFQRLLLDAPPHSDIADFILLHEISANSTLVGVPGSDAPLMQLLIEATHDFIVIKDPQGRWLFANAAIIEALELGSVAWLGKTDRELVDLANARVRDSLQFCHETDQVAWREKQRVRHLETLPGSEGRKLIVDVIKQPVFDDAGEPRAIIVVGRDVTELHTAQEQYQILASQDELTGLLNRRFFQLEAQRWIDSISTDEPHHLALLVFDLDYFRSINDSYGHERGDQLLQEMARRLQTECVTRPLLISRLGGDEFAILMETDNSPASLKALGDRIKSIAIRPFHIDNLTLLTSASTGIVIWPEHGKTIGELLHHADSAMYAAKEQGRNGHALFSPKLMEQQNRRSVQLTALRQGLAEKRFSLVYQVQQNAKSLAITGVEALLRWQAPTPDLAAGPEEFIPLLEQSGLIIDVGGWVLEEACTQLARWQKQGNERIGVAVNVSSVQLHAPCFIGRVRSALNKSGINPALLEVELTETALVNDPFKAASTLAELKGMGVQLALDDFGTGYSSLSYLTQFEFNRLKIDKGFVRDILEDQKDLVIVKAIIAMAHALALEVVAEGVETVAERDLLDSLDCDSFQGYLVGRPGKPDEIFPMLGVGLL